MRARSWVYISKLRKAWPCQVCVIRVLQPLCLSVCLSLSLSLSFSLLSLHQEYGQVSSRLLPSPSQALLSAALSCHTPSMGREAFKSGRRRSPLCAGTGMHTCCASTRHPLACRARRTHRERDEGNSKHRPPQHLDPCWPEGRALACHPFLFWAPHLSICLHIAATPPTLPVPTPHN